MEFDRIIVCLPCHSLHDFPTWLEEAEADALLTAWTAAWHPCLIAATGAVPRWAGVDVPPRDPGTLGIVPEPWDGRFATQADPAATAGSTWVRGALGREAIVAAAALAVGLDPAAGELPGAAWGEDFRGLGLAVLLAAVLAERMRSHADQDDAAFAAAVVRTARAAVASDAAGVTDGLRECFGWLEAARARYYPVDCWLIDLVLLADSTLGAALDGELDSDVSGGVVATGETIERLASRNPPALTRLRQRCADGTLTGVGGRHDSRPFDECTPEMIADGFRRGRAAWREHVGMVPCVYAQQTGGASPLLPELLTGLGYTGVLWTLFDGTPLPDAGGGRFVWEGGGGGRIDAVARPPLDARSAQTILALPERLGDRMDHDHTVVVTFAHYPGTASPWFDLLRRIGRLGTALGRFVTPAEFFRQAADAATPASFPPDAYPQARPPQDAAAGGADLARSIVAAREEAVKIVARRADLDAALAVSDVVRGDRSTAAEATRRSGLRGLLGWGRRSTDDLVLEHAQLRVQVHPQSGGILSVRRPTDRGNRLSQRLSIRTTRPRAAVGQAWEDAAERAVYAAMLADGMARVSAAAGRGEAIESRGRLVSSRGETMGSFTQRIELAEGAALVFLDVAVQLDRPAAGPFFEHYAACRFAWNENEDLDVRRSLSTQSIASDRGRFTAPWFIEVGTDDDPTATAGRRGRVAIFTGGLPWHVRSSPHMIDTILPPPTAGIAAPVRLAIGVGLERPWDAAAAVVAGDPAAAADGLLPRPAVPPNVRLTDGMVRREDGRVVGARVGLLESAGRAGTVQLAWAADVEQVTCTAPGSDGAIDAAHEPVTATIDGRTTTVFLERYQWLHLDVEFRR